MNIKLLAQATLSISLMFAMTACGIYSFNGASIHVDAKTVSIAYFPNNAAMVAPILSSTFRDALQDKFSRQTRLTLVQENGDLAFEGEIIGYTSTPSAISSNENERAVKNRLTITVRVRFSNRFEPQWNFPDAGRNFSAFLDYDSNILLTEAEGTLIPEIVDMLVEDIFNAAVSNW